MAVDLTCRPGFTVESVVGVALSGNLPRAARRLPMIGAATTTALGGL